VPNGDGPGKAQYSAGDVAGRKATLPTQFTGGDVDVKAGRKVDHFGRLKSVPPQMG